MVSLKCIYLYSLKLKYRCTQRIVGLPCCRNHIGGNKLVLDKRMFSVSWPLHLQLFTEGCFASPRTARQYNTTEFTMVFLLTGIQYLNTKVVLIWKFSRDRKWFNGQVRIWIFFLYLAYDGSNPDMTIAKVLMDMVI